MRLQYHYPAKPFAITQKWGVPRPEVYRQFGWDDHNGNDFRLGRRAGIHQWFPGTVIRIGNQPKGGGIFVSVLSDEKYEFDDGISAFVLTDYLHLERILVKQGDHVEPGQMIAIADNTGFSTGPHTHEQDRREMEVAIAEDVVAPNSYRIRGKRIVLEDLDQNKANNTFDPLRYVSGKFAEDFALGYIQRSLDAVAKTIAQLTRDAFGDELKPMARRICAEEGLTTQMTRELMATIHAESGWYTKATNENRNAAGEVLSVDYGLCQLNSYWYIGPHLDVKTPEEAVSNPAKCVRVMARAWKRGRAIDWIAYRDGKHLRYLSLY